MKDKHLDIPKEDLIQNIYFLCETWQCINDYVMENCCSEDHIMKYPVIQGLRNQLNIINVGKNKYDARTAMQCIGKMAED